MKAYSGLKSRLLLRVYKCLNDIVDEDYILDSAKGVLMDKTWLFKESNSNTANGPKGTDGAVLDMASVASLSR
jgi:hypothetical protein